MKIILLIFSLLACSKEPTPEELAPKPKQVMTHCLATYIQNCMEAINRECPDGYTNLQQTKLPASIKNIPILEITVECK